MESIYSVILALQQDNKWSVCSRSVHLQLPPAVVLSLWNTPLGSSFCLQLCVCPLKPLEAQVLAEEDDGLSAAGLLSSIILACSCHSCTQQDQRDPTTSFYHPLTALYFWYSIFPCELWLVSMVSSSLLAGISEIFAAGWWVMRPLAGMRWWCAIDFWRNCAWSYRLTTQTFSNCCFCPFLIFLIRIGFERQSLSSTPHFVGLASLYLPLLVRKNLCLWELKLCSKLFSNPVLFSNSKTVCVSQCMSKIYALFLHKC